MALIDAKKYGIRKDKILACKSIREVRNYLVDSGVRREYLDDVLRQKRKTKINRKFWSATVEGMVDLCFDEDSESNVVEVKERKVLRRGLAWIEFKTKAKDLFTISDEYKSLDEFASYASEDELTSLINNTN
jgi:hypothetical protein